METLWNLGHKSLRWDLYVPLHHVQIGSIIGMATCRRFIIFNIVSLHN
jgi:hypothetical protein